MNENISYSASIPMHILTDKRLSSTDKLVYTIVNGLSKKNGDCWAGNTYIAEQLDIKKDTVSKIVSKLVDMGYMKRKEFRNEHNQVVKRLLSTVHASSSLLPDFESISLPDNNDNPIGEKSYPSSNKILLDIEDYNNKDNTNIHMPKIENSKPKAPKKQFVPPTLDEVKAFVKEKGYKEELAIKAYSYYTDGNWRDKNDKPVLNWKLKLNMWFKDEYRITPQNDMVKVSTPFGDRLIVTREEYEKTKATTGFYKLID
jgi:DNA-binding Lrp family transcriptional regulator